MAKSDLPDKVREIILTRIEANLAAQLHFDQTLLQLRLLTLAIGVGTATLSGTVELSVSTVIWLAFGFLCVLALPFLYDVYSVDQQLRRGEFILHMESELKTLDKMSVDTLLKFIVKNPDPLLAVKPNERWKNRFKHCNKWQVSWYVGCWVVGLAILVAKPYVFGETSTTKQNPTTIVNVYKSYETNQTPNQSQDSLPQAPPQEPPQQESDNRND